MDNSIKIELATDMDQVREIVIQPDIWERISEEGIEPEDFYPVNDNFTGWFLCLEENEPIGIILVHTDNSISIKMHPYLRSKHREKGRIMMKAFYTWFLENTEKKVNKINVSIPIFHKRVINFAKKVGFKKEGVNRDSYRKDGQLYGQQNLGITRNEIEEYLDGRHR